MHIHICTQINIDTYVHIYIYTYAPISEALYSWHPQQRTLLWSYRRGFRELAELFTGVSRAQALDSENA